MKYQIKNKLFSLHREDAGVVGIVEAVFLEETLCPAVADVLDALDPQGVDNVDVAVDDAELELGADQGGAPLSQPERLALLEIGQDLFLDLAVVDLHPAEVEALELVGAIAQESGQDRSLGPSDFCRCAQRAFDGHVGPDVLAKDP